MVEERESPAWRGHPAGVPGPAPHRPMEAGPPFRHDLEFDGSRDARQRDLFPLPQLPLPPRPRRDLCRAVQQRGLRRVAAVRHCNEAITALNEMYAPQAACPSSQASRLQGLAQETMLGRFSHRPVGRSPSPQEALTELLGSDLSYSGEMVSQHMASFGQGPVAFPPAAQPPLLLQDLLGPEEREYAERFEELVMHGPEEWASIEAETEMATVYSDPALMHSQASYQRFVAELFHHHIVGFTQHPREFVGVFFVKKKDDSQRIICDARRLNQRCKAAPGIPMGGTATWSQFRIPAGEKLYVGMADVQSYFYRLGISEDIGRWFSMPQVDRDFVRELLGRPLAGEPGLPWYPYFSVLPMGFSWAMYFAQAVHLEMIRRSGAFRADRVVRDGCPPPVLSDPSAFTFPYCDNIHVGATAPEVADTALQSLIQTFREHRLSIHEVSLPTTVFRSLGVIVDGDSV